MSRQNRNCRFSVRGIPVLHDLWGDTEIQFVKDASGSVTGFELRQDGKVERAERLSEER